MHWHGVSKHEDAYDGAGILEHSPPPPSLLHAAATADIICASDMPRAIASAQRVADGRDILVSPLLREIRLEPPRWLPIRLPIDAWDAMSHVQWSARLVFRADHEFVRRATAAADWLVGQTNGMSGSPTILAVTHAAFRRILAADLAGRGWRPASRRRSFANWSIWEFIFDKR